MVAGAALFPVLAIVWFLCVRNVLRLSRRRMEVEEAYVAATDRMQELLGSLPVGVLIVDAETHRIVDANPKACAMVGLPSHDIAGKICHDFVCPAHEGMCPISDLGQVVDESERTLITADGRQVPVLKTVMDSDIDGRNHYIECFIDISEQKQVENERITREKMAGVLEMAGAVCHELNQPLQVISGYVEMLLDDPSEDDGDERILNIIREQVVRMSRITRKLNNITRYETKKYLECRIIDIDRAAARSHTCPDGRDEGPVFGRDVEAEEKMSAS